MQEESIVLLCTCTHLVHVNHGSHLMVLCQSNQGSCDEMVTHELCHNQEWNMTIIDCQTPCFNCLQKAHEVCFCHGMNVTSCVYFYQVYINHVGCSGWLCSSLIKMFAMKKWGLRSDIDLVTYIQCFREGTEVCFAKKMLPVYLYTPIKYMVVIGHMR